MSIFKRLVCLVLILTLIIVFSACENEKESQSEGLDIKKHLTYELPENYYDYKQSGSAPLPNTSHKDARVICIKEIPPKTHMLIWISMDKLSEPDEKLSKKSLAFEECKVIYIDGKKAYEGYRRVYKQGKLTVDYKTKNVIMRYNGYQIMIQGEAGKRMEDGAVGSKSYENLQIWNQFLQSIRFIDEDEYDAPITFDENNYPNNAERLIYGEKGDHGKATAGATLEYHFDPGKYTIENLLNYSTIVSVMKQNEKGSWDVRYVYVPYKGKLTFEIKQDEILMLEEYADLVIYPSK